MLCEYVGQFARYLTKARTSYRLIEIMMNHHLVVSGPNWISNVMPLNGFTKSHNNLTLLDLKVIFGRKFRYESLYGDIHWSRSITEPPE